MSTIDPNDSEKSMDEDNLLQKQTQAVSSHIINNESSSSSNVKTDGNVENININSTGHIDKEPNESMDSINLVASTSKAINKKKRNSNHLIASNSRCENNSKLTLNDTASITIPSILEKVDPSYSYIVSDSKIRHYIMKAKMIEPDAIINAYDPSEIDEIINDVVILDTRFYLVKWKQWSRGFNTWERYGALYNSQGILVNYIKKKTSKTNFNQVNGIELMLSRKVISDSFNSFRNEKGLSLPSISPEHVSGLFNTLDVGHIQVQTLQKKAFNSVLNTISVGYLRQRQFAKLQQWEIDINIVTQDFQIEVQNNMDLEGPPNLFAYVTEYVPHGIIIPDDPPIGCSCKKNCTSSDECCNEMSGFAAVYDERKNILIAPGSPIFECNKKCKCTASCSNRVVQHDSKVKVCIYKTRKCGWGVKASQIIQKGQFVARYIGEIITVEESEKRLKRGSSLMDHMWNLDFDDSQDFQYIIDSTHYANFTYFINHSCDANLNVYAVWINCLDRNLPQLALFANRDIAVGEQLTTDYFSRSNEKSSLKQSGIRCQCDMKNCKGYYF